MTIEEVKQIITNSKFEAGLKQRLVLLLPSLGRYTLDGLAKEVSRGDSLIIADYLVSLWESFANILDGLKKKDINSVDNLSKFLEENLLKFNGEDEVYFLNFVLDIRALTHRSLVKLSTEQYRQLLDFECQLFWQLPKDEILFLLSNHILYLLQKINLLEDTQTAVYKHDWDYNKNFNKSFLDALLQNKEVLSKNNPRTIGEWAKEFLSFNPAKFSPGDVMHIMEFLFKSPSVQKLTEQEKKYLSEILKLLIWLTKPELNEDEVRAYIEQAGLGQENKTAQLTTHKAEKFELPAEVFTAKPEKPTPVLSRAASQVTPNQPAAQYKALSVQDILSQKQRSEDIQGIKFAGGGGLNVEQLKTEAEKRRKKEQEQIDRKLEELRKRNPKL